MNHSFFFWQELRKKVKALMNEETELIRMKQKLRRWEKKLFVKRELRDKLMMVMVLFMDMVNLDRRILGKEIHCKALRLKQARCRQRRKQEELQEIYVWIEYITGSTQSVFLKSLCLKIKLSWCYRWLNIYHVNFFIFIQ